MKKLFIASLIVFCAACSSNTENSDKQGAPTNAEVTASKEYACPMQCEGKKTYAQAGKCPVCKMDLQEVAMAETDSTGHLH